MNKKKNKIQLVFGLIFLWLLFSASPTIIAMIVGKPVTPYLIRASIITAASIAYIYICVMVSTMLTRYRKIKAFRMESYGVAREVSSRTGYSYENIRYMIDKGIEYCKPRKLAYEYNNRIRIAFFRNNIIQFTYLTARECVKHDSDENLIKKQVELYCAKLPEENGVMPLEWCVNNAFWQSNDSIFEGLAVAFISLYIIHRIFT